jgi:hypothetical protein
MATTFAERIRQAASDFPGAHSTAWVQYLVGANNTVDVRMQAPEIMKEFRGNVRFGIDPKGILFFKSKDDLDIVGNIKIRNRRHTVTGTRVIAESEFGGPGPDFVAFARFVAEVDTATYDIPNFDPNRVGRGQMKAFDAVTCHVHATRQIDNSTVNLGSNSIHKQVYFTSQATTLISQPGVLFFPVLARLKTQPNNRDYCVADYSPGRIVFHIENAQNEVVALFIPNKPMNNIGQGIPRVTWEDIDPLMMMRLSGTDVEDDRDVVEASA